MPRNLTTEQACELALDWADRGVPVLPVELGFDEGKQKVNKRPKTRNGFKDATCDPDIIRSWYSTLNFDGPPAVGLVPGPAGCLVLDIDSDVDLATFSEYEFEPTYRIRTPSGHHLWWRKPEDVVVGTRCDLAGVDCVRSDLGFIIAPGNSCQWGSWVTYDEFESDIATAPTKLWQAIERRGAPIATSDLSIGGRERITRVLEAKGRHQDIVALATTMDQYGGHSPLMRGESVYLTRPGKSSGISASIGHVGPGVVKLFSSNWPGLNGDGRYIVSNNRLVADDDLSWISSVHRTPDNVADQDDGLLLRIDWKTLHERGNDLVEGMLSEGRWTAVASPAKTGKTTLLMAMAVNLAVGIDPFTGDSRPPVNVIYIDAEMGRLDLEERIFDLGFEPSDLDEHFYACDIVPHLDTIEGAQRVLRTAALFKASLVVIDGLNGALAGDENENTTLRSFFDHTIRPLKAHNVAILTGDNVGKDKSKGPRGSSVKLDKPDFVVRLERTDTGIKAVAVVRRSSSFLHEAVYEIEGLDGDRPITYRPASTAWPEGTMRTADLFDRHNIPIDWSRRRVQKFFRDAGMPGVRAATITAAQRLRRQSAENKAIRAIVGTQEDGQ